MSNSVKERAFAHPKNKALTLAHLRDILEQTKDLPSDFPIFVSSDEEGNRYGKLWQVDVTKKGLLLWPADAGNTPFDSGDF